MNGQNPNRDTLPSQGAPEQVIDISERKTLMISAANFAEFVLVNALGSED